MNNAAYKQLTGYTDHELAFFAKYRLPYLDEKVKEEIESYVRLERNLEADRMADLVAERIPPGKFWKVRCSRCGSEKLELEQYKKSCLICSFTSSRNDLLRWLNDLFRVLGYS